MQSPQGEKPVRGSDMFSDEELKDILNVNIEEDHVAVTCGCTSRTLGDCVGLMKIFPSGDLVIKCLCMPYPPDCPEDHISPAVFERHAGRDDSKWKSSIWVNMETGVKLPIFRTKLLKFYNERLMQAKVNGHQDQFLRCVKCRKERRFRMKTLEECRAYHDAAANPAWSCDDYSGAGCAEEEERASRKTTRGCAVSPLCRGCTSCVCFGCRLCRFPDCACRTCADFYAKNS